MQAAAGGGAGAGNVAAVLRDLGFYQYDIQHKENHNSFLRTNTIVILYLSKFNYKIHQKSEQKKGNLTKTAKKPVRRKKKASPKDKKRHFPWSMTKMQNKCEKIWKKSRR